MMIHPVLLASSLDDWGTIAFLVFIPFAIYFLLLFLALPNKVQLMMNDLAAIRALLEQQQKRDEEP